MFSLYCWETNKRAGTELVGTRISLFWFRTQVSQWPLRPSLNSLCSSLPSTHCGPAPLTFLSLDHQTSIPQDLCMCSYLCLEYLSLTQLGSFPIFFPPVTRFLLREAFLDCLCWVFSDCPSETPSIPLYTVLFWEAPAGFHASSGILLDQKVRGWSEVRGFLLGLPLWWLPWMGSLSLLKAPAKRLLPATPDTFPPLPS